MPPSECRLSRLDPHCPAKMTPAPARTLLGTPERERCSSMAMSQPLLAAAEPPVQPPCAPPGAARAEEGLGWHQSQHCRAEGLWVQPLLTLGSAVPFPSPTCPTQPHPLGKQGFVPCVPSWNDDLGRDLFYANKSLLAVTSTGCRANPGGRFPEAPRSTGTLEQALPPSYIPTAGIRAQQQLPGKGSALTVHI